MKTWAFSLAIEDGKGKPLFVRIADAISRDIGRGRLRPGDSLPGTRTLGATLGIHRSTVVAAYAELLAQGWIGTKQGGATRVAARDPAAPPHRLSRPRAPAASAPRPTGFDVAEVGVLVPLFTAVPRGALALRGGVPDPRLTPVDLLARAYRRAARTRGRHLLTYTTDAAGHPRLRDALASLVCATRGLAARADDVLITRGSQMALDLVARTLIKPGDTVVVEALSYLPAVRVFDRAGAQIVPVAIDGRGIDVSAVAALARRRTIRALYLTPQHQYPTTAVLSPARRLALLDLARRERIAIIEDDYDQEFHYEGRPVLPLASADVHGNVIYIGTLSKILAPGLRIGFVVAGPNLLARMTDERILLDRQGDPLLEYAVADLFHDGDMLRHVRRTRRIYHARRDALCEAFDRHFRGVFTYQRPAGGLALWATVAPDLDVEAFRARCEKAGLYFQTGRQFTVDGAYAPGLRIGYATLDGPRLSATMSRLRACLPRAGRQRIPPFTAPLHPRYSAP